MSERILIKNGIVLTCDEDNRIFEDGAIVIEDDRIIAVDTTSNIEKKFKGDVIIDAKKKAIIPGLVNLHFHTDITGRGTLEEMDLVDALYKRWYLMIKEVNAEEAYWAALQGYIEAIKSGTTCVNDQYRQMMSCAKAAEETGIRAVLSCDVAVKEEKLDTLQDNVTLYQEKNGSAEGRISIYFGIEWLPIASKEILIKTRELANKYKTGIHVHLNEGLTELELSKKKYGETPVVVAHETGLLGPDCVAAHCVHLTDYEIKLLHDTNTSVAHNPTSNAKVGNGVARITDMLKAGVNVGLGHDSVCGNNNSDLFEVMKWASLLQRAVKLDPYIMPATTMLPMATKNGGKALHQSIGSIKPGWKADVLIIDLKSHHFTPLILAENLNILPNLVYSAHGEDVNTSIINGKIVMENRVIKTVDESKVIEKTTESWHSLYNRIDKKIWSDIRRV